MIRLDCEQGSEAWWAARCGLPTASGFGRIVTPGGKLSGQRDGYLAELLAEWAMGEPVSAFEGNFATERGRVLEPEAFEFFAFVQDLQPSKVGFVYHDEQRMVGASPDFMVGDEPGELKCPEKPGIHLLRLIRGTVPNEHHAQTQGQLWVCGAARGWFMDYYPALPPVLVEVERDDRFCAALDAHIPTFIAELLAGRDRLRAMGVRSPLEDRHVPD